MKGTKKKKMK
jgi:uncharacterized protein